MLACLLAPSFHPHSLQRHETGTDTPFDDFGLDMLHLSTGTGILLGWVPFLCIDTLRNRNEPGLRRREDRMRDDADITDEDETR